MADRLTMTSFRFLTKRKKQAIIKQAQRADLIISPPGKGLQCITDLLTS